VNADERLDKLRAKLAKVRKTVPATGLEMAALDIKAANLEHEIYELEQLQGEDSP
jgi:predicted  nucleic acid-binding Zn-ribbon protein